VQRLLAVLLVLVGLIGLALGRLGETTWAPATETTATVELGDPGSAVVIDPGVLYVGGEEGQVVIEGASDVSVITAANGDIEAYLEDVRYTRITGASDWTTLSTQEVNPDGADELENPTSSDLWRTVETKPSPYTIDVADFWAGENGEENEQVYRSLLIVTDGTEPGAERVSITWPVDAENEWVPFAYAGGAAIAVIGLVMLVVSLGGRRRDEDDLNEVAEAPHQPQHGPSSVVAAGAGTAATPAADERSAADDSTEVLGVTDAPDSEAAAGPDPLLGGPGGDVREESVWSLGASSSEESGTPADQHTRNDSGAPADTDRTAPIRLFGEDGRGDGEELR